MWRCTATPPAPPSTKEATKSPPSMAASTRCTMPISSRPCRSRKKEDLNCDVQEGVLSATWCTWATSAIAWARRLPTDEVLNRLKAVKMSDNAQDTVDRVVDHLSTNGVTLDGSTMFQCGDFLKFDPQAVAFIGNEKANEMKSREYRTPFVLPTAAQV